MKNKVKGVTMKNGQMVLTENSPLHPRNGKPKNLQLAPIHSGMHFRDMSGKLIAGISRTQANAPLDDERLATKVGK